MRPLELLFAEVSRLTHKRSRESAEVVSNNMHPDDKRETTAEGDGKARVRDLTRRVLRGVLGETRSGSSLRAGVREDVREACDAAREHGLRAEELLVVVKQSWRDVSDADFAEGAGSTAPSSATQARRDQVLTEVITMFIREFYRPVSH
jgi:hypothetical protein